MTTRDTWNEVSKEAIVDIKDGLDSLNQKVHAIETDTQTRSNKFFQYTVLQHSQVNSVVLQISASGNIGLQAPEKALLSSSITVVCLTRYLIELYGVLKFLQENPKDRMDEWCRYSEIKLAEYSETLDNLGVLRKEFAHLNQSLQKSKNNVLIANTKFTDDATRIGSKY